MHAFVVSSSLVIGYLIINDIYKRCFPKVSYEEVDKIHQQFPFAHYISKTALLQFFSQDKNYERLQKILDLDNGILEKTLNLIQNQDQIRDHYLETQESFGENYFHSEINHPATIFDIRDSKFKTSLGQLNFFRWLIVNDYFLHIE